MRSLLLAMFCAVSSSAQIITSTSTPFVEKQAVLQLQSQVKSLTSGRTVITGQPQYLKGIKFADGTVQTSSATPYVSALTPSCRSGITTNSASLLSGCVSTTYFGSQYPDFNTALNTIGTASATLVIDSTLTVTANITSPVTLTLLFETPGLLAPVSNSTVTILSPIISPPVQIFGGAGYVILSSAAVFWVPPQWFGAKADCVTPVDDYAAIQASINACGTNASATNRGNLMFGPGCYYTTNTLEVSSQAYLAMGGIYGFDTFIYNNGGSSGTIHFASGNSLTAPSTLNNLGTYFIHDIGLGSITGVALYQDGGTNVVGRNVVMYSALTTSYFLINGGSQGRYSDFTIDASNTNIGVDPSGYFGTRTFTQPTSNIVIESVSNPGIITAEHSFVNLRASCGINGGDSISIIDSTTTGPSVNNIQFVNADVKGVAGKAGYFVDGAEVTITGGYVESCTSQTDAVYIKSSSQPATVRINGLSAGGGFLHINTLSNGGTSAGSYLNVAQSEFSKMIVDSAPYYAYGNNVNFANSATGAGKISDATIFSWLGMNNAGPSIGFGGPGEGFTAPNAVFTIATDAAGVLDAPVLSLWRQKPGGVQKWNLGVQSDKTLALVDATNAGDRPAIFQPGIKDSFYLFSSTGLSINSGVSGSAALLVTPLNASSTGTVINTGANPTADVFEANINNTIELAVHPDGSVAATNALTASRLSVTYDVLAATGNFTSGITVGTMTILGTALTVGGSSFTVSGGSATVAYQMKAGSFLGVSGATETTNASMVGVGTAANPLGVNSSSVAVLSSSLVLNQQIDSSSITKQGNTFNAASQLVKLDSNGAEQLAGSITASSGTFNGAGAPALLVVTNANIYHSSFSAGGYAISMYGGNGVSPQAGTGPNGALIGSTGKYPFYIGSQNDIAYSSIMIATSAAPTGGNVGIQTAFPSTALSVYGIVTSSTTTSTVSCNAGTGVMLANSNSQSGFFTAGTLATSCTVTFGTSFPKAPSCMCNGSVAGLFVNASASATNSVTCSASTALTGDTINYICWGAP